MRLFLLIFGFLFPFLSLAGQETVINLTISQPRELKVNAGADIITGSGTVSLGNNLQVSGGTPDFSYLWLLNDNTIASDKITEVTHSGKYIIKVIDSRNCSASDTVSVVFTSVREITSKLSCRVFPVPAHNTLFLEVPENELIQSLSILSIDGKKLVSLVPPQTGCLKTFETDISFLPKGFYFLSVLVSGQGCMVSFIKN
ncbi:MAG TPA: T9SS type A sorting domain-containing protein [Bacteroidales bacterium]|nr:T9SS type A sorting domain-containing protein [Bacteroidales bacterium]